MFWKENGPLELEADLGDKYGSAVLSGGEHSADKLCFVVSGLFGRLLADGIVAKICCAAGGFRWPGAGPHSRPPSAGCGLVSCKY